MKCCLIGNNLSQNHIPWLYEELVNGSFTLCAGKPDDLQTILRHSAFSGFIVEHPYKRSVIPFLDTLSEIAQKTMEVDTVIRKPDGTLFGHNSAFSGFQYLLHRNEIQVSGKKVLILGNDNTARTPAAVLQEAGANIVMISPDDLCQHTDASVLINMVSDSQGLTFPVQPLPHHKLEYVIDLSCGTFSSRLLMQAHQQRISYTNNVWMQIAQARESAELFCKAPIHEERIPVIYAQLLKRTQNIILVGMPGCGKTTIGKALAATMNRKSIDSDEWVTRMAGKSVAEIFSQDGEHTFRHLEAQVLSRFGKSSATVIATGGGCVVTPDNYYNLKQNGIIFWLERDLNALAMDGRPLYQKHTPQELFEERKSLYARFSDYVIENNSSIQDAVRSILDLWESIFQPTNIKTP